MLNYENVTSWFYVNFDVSHQKQQVMEMTNLEKVTYFTCLINSDEVNIGPT